MALTQSAFHQNRDFMLRFGEEVKSVEYGNVIDASFVDAL